MKPFSEWDSVGWGFLGVGFVILYGPCLYGMLLVTHEEQRATLFPYAVAGFGATIASGFVTAIVNSFLQRRFDAREATQKEQSKNKEG